MSVDISQIAPSKELDSGLRWDQGACSAKIQSDKDLARAVWPAWGAGEALYSRRSLLETAQIENTTVDVVLDGNCKIMKSRAGESLIS